ncbi:hypothetical protein BT96DRAFT_1015122 [Gymnopus androsaceus JB14]|uniref:Uncharacterized protein n=1 Tax=Gymnopus androsaceus JB14 TaxID=1447944 RepID=A0A6A4I8E5_9AGAR|nr:hypothetical protein BT96DRAFT_1015122 [Gymnopus androsaceus JB14]
MSQPSSEYSPHVSAVRQANGINVQRTHSRRCKCSFIELSLSLRRLYGRGHSSYSQRSSSSLGAIAIPGNSASPQQPPNPSSANQQHPAPPPNNQSANQQPPNQPDQQLPRHCSGISLERVPRIESRALAAIGKINTELGHDTTQGRVHQLCTTESQIGEESCWKPS